MTERTHTHHEHNHHERSKSKLFKRTTVLGNALIGTAEGLTAGGSSAILNDWIHNWIDAYIYNEQLNNIAEPNSPKAKSYKRRKAFFTLYASMSALLAAKAGVDFGVELTTDNDVEQNPLAIYTTGASVALNCGLGIARLQQMRRKRQSNETASHHDHDVNKHFAIDTASAALAFTAAATGTSLLAPLAGIASGVLGVTYFYPSEENLRESYHSHNGENQYSHEHHHQEKQKKKPSRLRKAVATVASAAVLAGGGIVGAKTSENNVETHWKDATAPAVTMTTPDTPQVKPPPPQTEIPLTECITAKRGDSRWKIIEQRIEQITHSDATDAVVYPTVIFATEPTISNPNSINPGECILAPTPEVTTIIHDSITSQQTEDQQLRKDLKELADQPSIEVAITKKQGVIKRIKEKIRQKIVNRR